MNTRYSHPFRLGQIRAGHGGFVAGLLILFSLTSSSGAIVSRDWWLPTPADANWTNKSVAEIKAAAERGEAVAQFYYARALFLGTVRQQDLSEALQWTRRAADQGYVEAQYTMARFHYDAVGTPHDHDQGYAWISRAVKQGHVEALEVMAWAYTFGEGVSVDGIKAREWLERALAAGAIGAPWAFGRYYLSGEGGRARRTNYVEALRWFERAATNGNLAALLTVSDLVEKGLGTPPDFPHALSGIRRCVDAGVPDAMERLASIYSAGQAEPHGPGDTPIHLLRRAAVRRAIGSDGVLVRNQSLIGVARELWNRYRLGIGTTRDYVAAAEWMWVACQEKLKPSIDEVAVSRMAQEHPFEPMLQGKTAALNADERLWHQAVRLVHEALESRKAEASYKIGEAYRDGGALTPKQPFMAWPWFARAAELNHSPARDALKSLEASLSPEELTNAKRIWVPPWRP